MSSIDFLSGTLSGCIVVLFGHPFDTTKTRLQTAPINYYRSTADCLRKTWANEGIRGFYKGMFSPLAGQMFFRACCFGTFHTTIRKMSELSQDRDLPIKYYALAGAFTGCTIAFVETPIDLVKTRLQIQVFNQGAQPSNYYNVRSCVRYIVNTHGILSLWKGFTGTLYRNIPANALFFSVNEQVKRQCNKYYSLPKDDFVFLRSLSAGALGGMAYWTLTYPLDVIKATMQANETAQFDSWSSTARQIYSSAGARGFFRGFLPCFLRSIPACGMMFTTVDFVRAIFTKQSPSLSHFPLVRMVNH